MKTLVAFFAASVDDDPVVVVARALGRALQLEVDAQPLPAPGAGAASDLLRTLAHPEVQMAVLPYRAGHTARLVSDIIQRCPTPVVIVPLDRHAHASPTVDRILVPLDGSLESAETVTWLVSMFHESGADIVVLHVFDRATVPKFWDQPVHAQQSWVEEFLRRYCDQPDVRMVLRSGNPGEHILDIAVTEHADLIALGWSQDLSAGRAAIVRSSLATSEIPVLLLPIPSAGTDAASRLAAMVRPSARP